jgi:hypothetical protein
MRSYYRSIAHLDSGEESLIYMGESQFKINNAYAKAFFDVLHEDVRRMVKRISLQRWVGKQGCGQWHVISYLKIPTKPPVDYTYGRRLIRQ